MMPQGERTPCNGLPSGIRLAHAHELDLRDRTQRAGERHLRDDLRAAEVALEAVPARHAEHAADRAADLGRDAQGIARQQDALHRPAVGQFDQQARGTILAGVPGTQACDRPQVGRNRGQCSADLQGEKMLGPAPAAVQRQRLRPGPQQRLLVAGFCAERAKPLADVFDAHGQRRMLASAGSLAAVARIAYAVGLEDRYTNTYREILKWLKEEESCAC